MGSLLSQFLAIFLFCDFSAQGTVFLSFSASCSYGILHDLPAESVS